MPVLIEAWACAAALQIASLWACLAATLLHFRVSRRPSRTDLPRMTLIKPVRGLDDDFAENLESIAASDPRRLLQVIIAMESAGDPAYPAAAAFAAAHPDRDIAVVITGPSGERMGKMHNMIEAIPRAKHDAILFSDADVRTTPGMIAETAEAFASGSDCVYGLPYHLPAPGLGGWQFMVAFNHGFCLPAALSDKLGLFRFCSGAWMGYTRKTLDRIGGLKPYAQAIADDFALGDSARRAGARGVLLHEPVFLKETGRGALEAARHLAKWCAIVRWSVPGLYFAAPLLSASAVCGGLWLTCEASGRFLWLGRGLLAAQMLSRALVGFLQDSRIGRGRMAWWGYALLAFADFGAIFYWLSGLRSLIRWRGKTYRLSPGGRARVIEAP